MSQVEQNQMKLGGAMALGRHGGGAGTGLPMVGGLEAGLRMQVGSQEHMLPR